MRIVGSEGTNSNETLSTRSSFDDGRPVHSGRTASSDAVSGPGLLSVHAGLGVPARLYRFSHSRASEAWAQGAVPSIHRPRCYVAGRSRRIGPARRWKTACHCRRMMSPVQSRTPPSSAVWTSGRADERAGRARGTWRSPRTSDLRRWRPAEPGGRRRGGCRCRGGREGMTWGPLGAGWVVPLALAGEAREYGRGVERARVGRVDALVSRPQGWPVRLCTLLSRSRSTGRQRCRMSRCPVSR